MVTREREDITERELAIHGVVDKKPTRNEIDAFIESHEFPLVEGSYTTFVGKPKERKSMEHYCVKTLQVSRNSGQTSVWPFFSEQCSLMFL